MCAVVIQQRENVSEDKPTCVVAGVRRGWDGSFEPGALSQGIVKSLNMGGFSRFLSNRTVFCDRNDRLIGVPEVSIALSSAVLWRNRLPELATGAFITIAQRIANNLASFSANSQPYPDFIGLLRNEEPKLIKFERVAVRFAQIRIYQGRSQRWQLLGFF